MLDQSALTELPHNESSALGRDWGRAACLRLPPQRHFKALVLSDTHFPREDCHPDLLYEFLRHHSADCYIWLGDTHEGYDDRLADLPDSYLRVKDLLHARLAQGAQMIDIPGNHDVYKRQQSIMGQRFFGMDYWPELMLDTSAGRVLMQHGDGLEGNYHYSRERMLYKAFQSLQKTQPSVSEVGKKALQKEYKMFRRRKIGKERTPFAQRAAALARSRDCEMIICGHKHEPTPFTRVKEFEDVSYANTGSWVDGQATAMALTHQDQWILIDWRQERGKYFKHNAPEVDEPRNLSAYRDLSLQEHAWQQAHHAVFTYKGYIGEAKRAMKSIKTNQRSFDKMLAFAWERLAVAKDAVTQAEKFADRQPAEMVQLDYAANARSYLWG